MRRFSADYLRRTRVGMWDDSRDALADLDLPGRRRTVDVGCGTGELSGVLATETDGEVIGCDADRRLLSVARRQTGLPVVAGDATRLPFGDGVADLVVCQALLVNLSAPVEALREFRRVSSDLVAVVEPDNADVGVTSTVDSEETLERRVREAYLDGVATDVSLGDSLSDLFEAAGLDVVGTRRYHHTKLVEPPYREEHLQSAARKASGAGLSDHERELRRVLSDSEYDAVRTKWRAMGRSVVDQMRDEEYRRAEVVPFDVVVGRVPDDA
ncbi:MAG: class I SAM-dependent methyltransferase [Halobacteriota archaeon]